ncbi:MAG: ATP-binding protein, partial [Acidobacteria bacterium]|nr:ATP-binding protein [Acidobacteriota bacterium]
LHMPDVTDSLPPPSPSPTAEVNQLSFAPLHSAALSEDVALTGEDNSAIRRLQVALDARFIALILSDHGPTRTRLLAHLAGSLPAAEYRLLRLSVPPQATRSRLTSLISGSAGLIDTEGATGTHARPTAYDLLRRFEAEAVRSYTDGRRTLVIFDDAHLLPAAGLHLIHSLSNITAANDLAVALVLAAATSFGVRLRRPAWRALASRTGAVVRVGVEQ